MESDRRGIATSAMCRNVQIRPLQLPPADRTGSSRSCAASSSSSRRMSAHGPSATIRPPESITARSHSSAANGRSWVTTSIVRSSRAEHLQQLAARARVEVRRRLVEHEHPRVASRARSRSRRAAAGRARAGAARGRPRAPSAPPPAPRATRSTASSRASPRLSGPNATSSRTVGMNSWSSGSWNTSPTRARRSRTSPRDVACRPPRGPRRRAAAPLRWSISVVLPAPFGPEHRDALAVARRAGRRRRARRRRSGSGSAARARRSRSSCRDHRGRAAAGARGERARNAASARAKASTRSRGIAPA